MNDHQCVTKVGNPKLSICIATYNRAKFIGETLDSILSQLVDGVELIIVDGASPDNTQEVMEQYTSRFPEIRYYREEQNSGIDADYDKAVGYAKGDYCWLMTDDDLLVPGAISRVLTELDNQGDLIIVNAEIKNSDLTKILNKSLFNYSSNKYNKIAGKDVFFSENAQGLSFIGCVVIKRSFWLSRNRSSYYGTLFVHVGVIFQEPPIDKASIITKPLIIVRYGNAMWSPRGFEIWMFKWPQLIWSFSSLSDEVKAIVCPREPWRKLKNLVLQRAVGGYGLNEYHRFLLNKTSAISRLLLVTIAIIPAKAINTLASLYCLFFNRNGRVAVYDFSRSKHSTIVSRLIARILGI